ncbi:MAG: transposase, partial [Erysipelotrichaceae bacterium]|nr:transposase [Erysipelotrichaceae bacterium]
MNRKEKRELRKDKNLIKEIYSIINKYLPDLFDKFNNLTDIRNQSYITYNMKVICVTRLFGLLCGLTSMTAISDKINSEDAINNLSSICKENLKEIPYWETIQDVFINIDINELRDIQKYIVKALIRSKMFDKYRYNGCFQLLFDGTGLSNHDYNLNGNCLSRKTKDGKISYYKYVLECKLVVGSIVISLDSEFIENEKMLTEEQKQDCETKAFKRMIKRIKKNYPKYKFIVTGDGLYATTPIINICNQYKWFYIFNLKPDRLKNVNEIVEDNINYHNETSIKNYFLSSNIEFKNNIVNVLKYIENEKNFRYISNLEINNHNIKSVVSLGRKRWKIENEGFYIQKHRTFNICHLSSRNDNAMKCHYFFIQFAHTIRQLLEKGNSLTKLLKLKIKEVSSFLLNGLTSTT